MIDSLIGQKIGRYQIVAHLGKGGMAEVYKGYQESLDRFVAIKLMHTFLITETDFLKRFQREARAMASLSHPNIVRIFDFDTYGDNAYYLVMEYINGGSLNEYLEELNAQGEKLPLKKAVQICTEIADALAYAHRRKMIHRDIKPANVMLDNDSGKALLTDFGIVKLAGNQSLAYTATGAMIGTPAYMSPEQALGQPGDERLDIYSLGVMIFQMVTGQLPFDADTPLAVVMKHVNELPPLPMSFNPDVPLALQEVILKALAKDPADRFQSAKALANRLRAVDLSSSGVGAAAGSPLTTQSSPTLMGLAEANDGLAATSSQAIENDPPASSTAVPQAQGPPTARSPWLWTLIGVLGMFMIGLGLYFSGVLTAAPPEPTKSAAAVIVSEPTVNPSPTEEPTTVSTVTPTALNQFDVVRTVNAEIALTRIAAATDTPTPTATATKRPTETPTTDPTIVFMSTCTVGVELVQVNRHGFNSTAVPVNTPFRLDWVLRNVGTCPWLADYQWVQVGRDDLAYQGEGVLLETAVPADEEITLSAQFGSLPGPNAFESTWQLQASNGDLIGDPITIEVRSYIPATATPIAPTATPTAEPAAAVDDWQANWAFDISLCEYVNNMDWRCLVTIYPYVDGTGAQGIQGDFTVLVFDQPNGQAAEYRGVGPFTHTIIYRRCNIYNTEIRVIDDLTGTEASRRQLSVDPDSYFEGGCSES